MLHPGEKILMKTNKKNCGNVKRFFDKILSVRMYLFNTVLRPKGRGSLYECVALSSIGISFNWTMCLRVAR